MSTVTTFHGTFYYPDERALRKALSDAKAALGAADSDLADEVSRQWRQFFLPEEMSLHVEVSLPSAAKFFAGMQPLIKALAERANAGEVEGTPGGPGGQPMRIPARGEELE